MRLQPWVNVVLVLILLASCGADHLTAGQVADEVVDRIGRVDTSTVDPSVDRVEMDELCRLVGAVLDAQDQRVDDVLGSDAATQCAAAARQGATR